MTRNCNKVSKLLALILAVQVFGLARCPAPPVELRKATQAEVNAGSPVNAYVGPDTLNAWTGGGGGPTNGQTAAQVQATVNTSSNLSYALTYNHPSSNSLWVDLNYGDDTKGKRGSEVLKFATIQAAQNASQAGDTIFWTGTTNGMASSIALTNTTLIAVGDSSITFTNHNFLNNGSGNVTISGGNFTNVLYAVFNYTTSTTLTNLVIKNVHAWGGSDNIQANGFPSGGTCAVENNWLGSIFDASNVGGATSNFNGVVMGNQFWMTNAALGAELRAVGAGLGNVQIVGNTFSIRNAGGVTGCAAIYIGDPGANCWIAGNTFITNGSTAYTPYIDNATYFTSTNVYVAGHPFMETNVVGTVNYQGWNGGTLVSAGSNLAVTAVTNAATGQITFTAALADPANLGQANIGTAWLTNVVVPTNSFAGTVVDFAKGDSLTNLGGGLTFTGVANVTAGAVNTCIIRCLANGADRSIAFPGSWKLSTGTTTVVTNGYESDFLFTVLPGIRTNVAQLDYLP